MIEGNVIIIGKEAWDAKVLRIIAGMKDFRIPFKQTEIYLEGRFADTFEKEGEPGWKPHANPMTAMLKRGSSGGKILQDTGRLKSTMTSSGRAGSRRRIRPMRMEYGVSNNYKVAHYMEKGARVPVTDKMRAFLAYRGVFLKSDTDTIVIPPRPFMHFVPRDLPKIEKIFNNYIDALIV